MARLKGIDEVLANLSKQTKRIQGGSEKGTLKGALLVKKESMKLTPIRLGNLRNSAYILSALLNKPQAGDITEGAFKGEDAGKMEATHKVVKTTTKAKAIALSRGGRDPVSAVGYSAVYALTVHENPNAGSAGGSAEANKARTGKKVALFKIHSKRGQWKFLEQPLNENQQHIFEIIKREAEITGG